VKPTTLPTTCEITGVPRPECCPLSKVRAGTCVRIKQLLASPDLCQRLREMGLCEEQRIKLLLRDRSVVCQVCNVRLGLSGSVADSIWVEPLPGPKPAA
jgi:ferrous iron transport protein A